MCFKCTPTQPDNHCHHKEGTWSKVTRTEIFVLVHPAESWGLSKYLWLHCRKQTLICWWSYYVVMKHCSFTESVRHFFFLFDCWLKCSTFKFFIKKQKTKEWDQSPTKLCSKSCHLQDQRTQYVSIYNFFMLKTWLWKAKSLQTDGIRPGNQWIVCI